MGMYDTFKARCPNCNKLTTAQSKAGSCTLKVYSLHDAPAAVLADVQDMGNRGELACTHCHKKWTLHLYVTAHPVELEEK